MAEGREGSGPVSFQLPLKPTSVKPTERDDGIPRSNEFSAPVSSYSLPKDFSWFRGRFPALSEVPVSGYRQISPAAPSEYVNTSMCARSHARRVHAIRFPAQIPALARRSFSRKSKTPLLDRSLPFPPTSLRRTGGAVSYPLEEPVVIERINISPVTPRAGRVLIARIKRSRGGRRSRNKKRAARVMRTSLNYASAKELSRLTSRISERAGG